MDHIAYGSFHLETLLDRLTLEQYKSLFRRPMREVFSHDECKMLKAILNRLK